MCDTLNYMEDVVSLKLLENKVEEVINHYKDYQLDNEGDYVLFFAKKKDTTITLYQSKKGYTLTFIGSDSLKEAKFWDENAEVKEKKAKVKEEWLSFNEQIGSDEVGVGDLFLPMIVVAAYVRKDQMKLLLSLGVHDSKKLNDEDILNIAPTLIKEFQFSKLTLQNDKYNEMIDKGENLNSLKAKMHNRALLNLKKKHPLNKEIYVDQFVNEKTYFNYLKDETEVLTHITFKTKGESYYPSVALGSIIARYSFLNEKRKLEEKYQLSFPLGAGKKADEFIKLFLEKYGKEELLKVVKKNFANMKEIL